ncbi:hypothetical protein D7V86_10545 [bacterium D16-51]|nr:hypothetical protein D7V96_11310 [bacterium D16-59]RKI59936.1 hypothetical protein D7V86_10545 [bacterium D16-51]
MKDVTRDREDRKQQRTSTEGALFFKAGKSSTYGNCWQRKCKKFLLIVILLCAVFLDGITASAPGRQAEAAVVGGGQKLGYAPLLCSGGFDYLQQERNMKLNLGEEVSLAVPGEKVLFCKSSKKKVVSVSKKGTIHALKAGKAKITVKSELGGETTTKRYHIKVSKFGMVYPVFTMMKGEHLDLQCNKENIHIKWSSANPSVAKVSKSGKVIAKRKGKAVLVGKSKNGKRYCCRLKVKKRVQNVIYLTFDDGPNRYSTTKILDILKKNHVKATFFELKPAQKDFDLTKRVIDEGHTLALHGYQHKYDIIYQSEKSYHENLDKLRDLFFAKYGVWCIVSRFPGGSSNMVSKYNPGIMTKLTAKLHSWGYHYFDWNVDSCDAGGASSSRETYSNFCASLRKGRGNVVLMHDFANNDKTINALEKMIQYGKKNGYTFLPITASTDEVHHPVNN